MSGRVVDANGAGVGGVTVSSQEPLTLSQELYLQGKPVSAEGVERTATPETTSAVMPNEALRETRAVTTTAPNLLARSSRAPRLSAP